jgi:hypothetical protein
MGSDLLSNGPHIREVSAAIVTLRGGKAEKYDFGAIKGPDDIRREGQMSRFHSALDSIVHPLFSNRGNSVAQRSNFFGVNICGSNQMTEF